MVTINNKPSFKLLILILSELLTISLVVQSMVQLERQVSFVMLKNHTYQKEYMIGRKFRAKYGHLFEDWFNSDKVHISTSSQSNAQQSAQAVFAGVYADPSNSSFTPLSFQPISYRIDDRTLNPLSIRPPCAQIHRSWTELTGIIADMDIKGQICATHPTCRNALTGYWLRDIVNHLSVFMEYYQKAELHDDSAAANVVYYSTNKVLMLSLLSLLAVEKYSIDEVEGFALEFTHEFYPAIRTVLISRHGMEYNRVFDACVIRENEPVEWCPLSVFIERLRMQLTGENAKYFDMCGFDDNDNLQVSDSSSSAEDKHSHSSTLTSSLKETNAKGVRTVKEQQNENHHVDGDRDDSDELHCWDEWDRAGPVACASWAQMDHCRKYLNIRRYLCRKTCLCQPLLFL